MLFLDYSFRYIETQQHLRWLGKRLDVNQGAGHGMTCQSLSLKLLKLGRSASVMPRRLAGTGSSARQKQIFSASMGSLSYKADSVCYCAAPQVGMPLLLLFPPLTQSPHPHCGHGMPFTCTQRRTPEGQL
jgi:hypothetical protein